MQVTLSPEMQKIVEERVRSGAFGSPEEVVAAGLSLLSEDPLADLPPEELEELRHEIRRGTEALDRGEISQWTAESLIAELDAHLAKEKRAG